MKRKILTAVVSLTALSLCILCLASCKDVENNNPDPATTASAALNNVSDTNNDTDNEKSGVFINTAHPLEFGFLSCYTNPQHEENPENEENSFGIVDSAGNVVVEPKYANAYPVSRNTFAVAKVEDGKTYSSMIDGNGKTVIPSFNGEIVPVCYEDNAKVAIIEPQGKKAYLVDMAGNKLLDLEFNTAFVAAETRQDVIEAYTDKTAYFISLDGKIIAELPANKPVLDPFGEGKGGTVIAGCYMPEKSEGRIFYGLYDSKSGREIVPCTRKNGFAVNENRFVLKDASAMGLDYNDFAAIYDEKGNLICADGKYQDIIFKSGSSSGVGVTIKPTEDLTGSEVKYYRIDADGNAVSPALDSMPTE